MEIYAAILYLFIKQKVFLRNRDSYEVSRMLHRKKWHIPPDPIELECIKQCTSCHI